VISKVGVIHLYVGIQDCDYYLRRLAPDRPSFRRIYVGILDSVHISDEGLPDIVKAPQKIEVLIIGKYGSSSKDLSVRLNILNSWICFEGTHCLSRHHIRLHSHMIESEPFRECLAGIEFDLPDNIHGRTDHDLFCLSSSYTRNESHKVFAWNKLFGPLLPRRLPFLGIKCNCGRFIGHSCPSDAKGNHCKQHSDDYKQSCTSLHCEIGSSSVSISDALASASPQEKQPGTCHAVLPTHHPLLVRANLIEFSLKNGQPRI
jgi:hypothetical protein